MFLLLVLLVINGPQQSDDLIDILNNVLLKFSLNHCSIQYVTDDGKNLICTVEILKKQHRNRCVIHALLLLFFKELLRIVKSNKNMCEKRHKMFHHLQSNQFLLNQGFDVYKDTNSYFKSDFSPSDSEDSASEPDVSNPSKTHKRLKKNTTT